MTKSLIVTIVLCLMVLAVILLTVFAPKDEENELARRVKIITIVILTTSVLLTIGKKVVELIDRLY